MCTSYEHNAYVIVYMCSFSLGAIKGLFSICYLYSFIINFVKLVHVMDFLPIE